MLVIAGGVAPRAGHLAGPRAIRAVGRTGVFVLKVLPMLWSRPIDWITPRPVVQRVIYPTAHGPAEGDLYRPASSRAAPGIVVCLGVVPFGVEHPQVARLGEALARSGFAALLYWSPAMRDRRLDPADAESLARAYGWLVEQPGIDGARSGLLGTCVGGAFALMAAARPAIRDRVAFVAAFAPYGSMESFVHDIASATRDRGAGRERWHVDPLTRDVFERTVAALVPASEQEAVAHASRGAASLEGDALSTQARAAWALLTATNPREASAALVALPASMHAHLRALSPSTTVHELRAPVIVIGHDRDDHVIPVSESRALVTLLEGRPGVRYTEFAFFQHATPRHLAIGPLARELGRFFAYVYPLFRAVA